MRKAALLLMIICCIGAAFAAVEWNVESGVWSDGANWNTGVKPDGTADIGLRFSDSSVCTVDTNEGLINNRMTVQNGQTFNIVDGGYVGTTWTRFGRNTAAYVNLSGNGTYVMYDENAQIGADAGGYCKWTMSDTSSLLTNSGTKGIVGLGEKSAEGWFKLVGSSVTVNVNQISITSYQGVNTATLEYVMDTGGASTIMTGSVDIAGFGNAYLELSATATLAEQDIVLIQNSGANPVAGAGAFTAMNGGPATEGSKIVLGGNIYTLTYQYAADVDSNNNDIALVFESTAKHLAGSPSPADNSTQIASPTTLSWTNPDPNDGVSDITCTVYLGIAPADPNRVGMDSVTLAANVSTVDINATNFPTYGAQPLDDPNQFYWVVDCVDASAGVAPAEGKAPVSWTFLTNYNVPPVVNAGTDQVLYGDGVNYPTVNLDGTASDTDGPDPLSVLWTLTGGPDSAVINTPSAQDTTVTVTESGVYEFTLTGDDGAAQVSDAVQVIVGIDSCEASVLNGSYYNSKDFDQDCDVDLVDFADFAADWMACTNTLEGC